MFTRGEGRGYGWILPYVGGAAARVGRAGEEVQSLSSQRLVCFCLLCSLERRRDDG